MDLKKIITDAATKPPLLFPFVGLFHLVWLIVVVCGLFGSPFGIEESIRLGWMLGYTAFWLGACNLKKWGAWGYMALTLTNALLFVCLKSPVDKSIYTSSMFLIDGIFSFFLLFFYKRFE